MGLEIQKKKDGSLKSNWWYGRFEMDGRNHCINLGVEIKGRIPKTLRKQGDTAFECSRTLAGAKLKELQSEARNTKTAKHHLQELYEIKAGEDIALIPLKELEAHWEVIPSKRKRATQQTKRQKASIRQFREFIEANFPAATLMSQITRRMALGWMKDINDKGMSATSYNVKLSLLRGIFEQLGPEAGVIANPFAGIPYRALNTVHRQPFTQEELNQILNHCDPILRPVVLTAMCTAMRRGDCCRLKWESVDMEGGFVTVKTSKTGEVAEIPLFPALRSELEHLPRVSEFVFPEAEEMYRTNIHGLSWRFKKALKNAGITDTVVEREDTRMKASVKDFHSLRTTWITMALSAGVPMELVRRVTGHSTVDVVLKHYFRPGKEAFKTALETAMPKMLTGGGEEAPETEAEDQKSDDSNQELLKKIRGLLEFGEDLEKDAILRRLAEIEKELAA
ncbi:tyrosine-type recombinase/integrase [Tichowtungia aerotolerans]|uniref:Tyrosine-type recombinase/integrase n=1 Tax=Tichowtungia aerotolerans TaxID=2697043 RepID=A0A6P1MA51_9BACT|nr:tyrosine-type recombinase/integrase [Tichowtungia aerotolerans]QHI68456.1 tyrosine-type recombinase/integrase [Tichowtungia aerotolerans]